MFKLFSIFLLGNICRKFAATIPRKFSVHFNPYTQRMEIIDRPRQLQRIANSVRAEMNRLYDAIAKVC